jgi:hypothetical protein
MECPCKGDCPRRSPTCHGECDDYKAYRDELDEVNKKVRATKILGYSDSYLWKLHLKKLRRKC